MKIETRQNKNKAQKIFLVKPDNFSLRQEYAKNIDQTKQIIMKFLFEEVDLEYEKQIKFLNIDTTAMKAKATVERGEKKENYEFEIFSFDDIGSFLFGGFPDSQVLNF